MLLISNQMFIIKPCLVCKSTSYECNDSIYVQTVKIAIELGEAEKEKNDVNRQVTRDCAIH